MRRHLCIFFLFLFNSLIAEDEGHLINFNKVSALELVKFVSRIAEVNFIFKEEILLFDVSFVSNKPASSHKVLDAMIQVLEQNGLEVSKEAGGYYLIKEVKTPLFGTQGKKETLSTKDGQFFVHKLQYQKGSEIQTALKQIVSESMASGAASLDLIHSIQSLQWIASTNSLLFSGSEESISRISHLIRTLDKPLRQVFIEVLVIETDIKNSLDFGLQWSNPFPLGSGFDLGVIGDIILHKGKSFLSLASLVKALQIDGDSSIVLNQKIITQDNKLSKIFVGDNIPFPGSVVQTVGNGQQTTANIEYKDIGVSLHITPLLGENDIITLDISEEITEAVPHAVAMSMPHQGIQTTKTNMITSVHVPNEHFLVLSGMTRSRQRITTSSIPCLGAIPMIGRIFRSEQREEEKRNIIVFVKPHIVDSVEEYQKISKEVSLDHNQKFVKASSN
ncbi:MAG: type II secretion system protein GspD [Chlamydiae bacterium]|nr:type II secretion system protein GspD [Chlamydiota bacterium]